MYSALKHKGKPLYAYARQGVDIERPPRKVFIKELTLQQADFEAHTLKCTVTCSKGTYIRSLMEDLGELLDCGAFVKELRRTHMAGFSPQDMVALADIEKVAESFEEASPDHYLLPVDRPFANFPSLYLKHQHAVDLIHGREVFVDDLDRVGLLVAYHESGEWIGMVDRFADNRIKVKKLMPCHHLLFWAK
jgi:tRNA pseudouridine55 synthase